MVIDMLTIIIYTDNSVLKRFKRFLYKNKRTQYDNIEYKYITAEYNLNF